MPWAGNLRSSCHTGTFEVDAYTFRGIRPRCLVARHLLHFGKKFEDQDSGSNRAPDRKNSKQPAVCRRKGPAHNYTAKPQIEGGARGDLVLFFVEDLAGCSPTLINDAGAMRRLPRRQTVDRCQKGSGNWERNRPAAQSSKCMEIV